ncbi:MAG TPA: hypothetical protein VF941_17345 [Clostridia bacterium]
MEYLLKRPSLIVIMGLAVFLLSFFEYNIILPALFGIAVFSKGDFFMAGMSVLQSIFGILCSQGGPVKVLAVFMAVVLFLSIVVPLIFSGYAGLINNIIDGKPRIKKELVESVKSYFKRFFIISIKAVPIVLILIITFIVTLVPGMVMTWSAFNGKAWLAIPSAVVDFITIFVLFFGCLFLRIYILFWYPASASMPDNSFRRGRNFSNSNFWVITKKILLFDAGFITVQLLLIAGELYIMSFHDKMSILLISICIVGWILRTILFGSFVAYIFSFYKKMQGDN